MIELAENKEKLIGLLGLARKAGVLAVGFTAVEKLVKRGQRPLVVLATDVGASQRGKITRWEPVRGFLVDVLTSKEMAEAFGRDKLVVVGLSDPGFVHGIAKLGFLK